MKQLLRCRGIDALVLPLAMAASALYSLHLGLNRCWDQFNYHYYSGYALLHERFGYDFAPAQVQSFFNPIMQVPAYLMLRYLPSRVTTLILGAVQGINLWLVYEISDSMFSRLLRPLRVLLCLVIALTAYLGAANVSEIGTTFGDNLISILPLTAILVIVRHLQANGPADHRTSVRLAMAGLIGGLAAGLKLTVAVYVLPMAVAVTVVEIVSRARVRILGSLYAGILLGFLISYGYWGLALYRSYRNPFYPYFNNLFHSEYYGSDDARDPRFLPRTRMQAFFYPFYIARLNNLTSEVRFRDVRLAVCYVLVIVLAGYYCFGLLARAGPRIFGSLKPGERRCLDFITLLLPLSYILWQQAFSIYRYAIVLECLAPVFISLCIMSLVPRQWIFLSAALLLNAFICWQRVPLDFGREAFVDGYLKVQPPAWDHLGESVVLMARGEGSAYIIPSFPSSTRFVRVESNFTYPGRNTNLDARIRALLAPYSRDRTLVYLYSMEELKTAAPAFAYYGVGIDASSCVEVKSANEKNAGYLCRTQDPRLEASGDVKLEVTPPVALVNKDTLVFKVFNLHAGAIDVLYTLDDKEMPPILGWRLDADQAVRTFVSESTRRGRYHIIGVRDSYSREKDRWFRVDVEVVVK